MFDFLKEVQAKRGVKLPSVGIFSEDTLFGSDSASDSAKVQRLKEAAPAVLLQTFYTSDAILYVKTAGTVLL